MKKSTWVRLTSIILIGICLIFSAVIFKAFLQGKFNSVDTLQEYIEGYGFFGPAVLTFVQLMQVVIPILPGFLGCVVGTILFGCAEGFWCNYIGISLGSIIAFLLAKKYGVKLVKSLFPENKYKKWTTWASHSKSYVAFLFMAMLLPLFPDDFFCYFSGLTEMRTKKFIWIILLGKPWCIFAYCYGLSLLK